MEYWQNVLSVAWNSKYLTSQLSRQQKFRYKYLRQEQIALVQEDQQQRNTRTINHPRRMYTFL